MEDGEVRRRFICFSQAAYWQRQSIRVYTSIIDLKPKFLVNRKLFSTESTVVLRLNME